MQVPDLEENLLEGVVLTNSISCPNPDLSGQFTIDAFEGLSLTAELDEEFKLSSNEEDNERGVLHDISHDQSSFDINLLTQTKKVGTGRHRVNPGRSSVMKAKRPARVRDR